ncbi:MAG: hypothetical protein ACOYN8_06675 [Pseudanabaena sp.]|jgi:hypothetical protein
MKYLTEKAKKAVTTRNKEFVIDTIMALSNSVDCGCKVAPLEGGELNIHDDFWLIEYLSGLPKELKLTLISDLALFYRDKHLN